MEGRYLPFIYQIGISIGCIRLLRRKQLLIDIDHLLGQCLEFQLIRCQKCLISCIGTITGQCGIQQLLLTSRSRTAVIHGHIACQMHDVRSVLLSTHLNGFGIQTGIGFHGLLVGTVIILKIPVGIVFAVSECCIKLTICFSVILLLIRLKIFWILFWVSPYSASV